MPLIVPWLMRVTDRLCRALPDHNAFTERPDIVDDLFLLLNRGESSTVLASHDRLCRAAGGRHL